MCREQSGQRAGRRDCSIVKIDIRHAKRTLQKTQEGVSQYVHLAFLFCVIQPRVCVWLGGWGEGQGEGCHTSCKRQIHGRKRIEVIVAGGGDLTTPGTRQKKMADVPRHRSRNRPWRSSLGTLLWGSHPFVADLQKSLT